MEKSGDPWIDISVALHPGLPSWPGDPPFALRRVADPAAGDEAAVSGLSLCAHAGTHVDAPSHFLPGAPGIESFPWAAGNGAVQVIDVTEPGGIGAGLVQENLAPGCRRVLFRTRNSAFWEEQGFRSDYTFLAADGAGFLIGKGVVLVGIDYLSIGSQDPARDVHRQLLAAGVWILEGLDLRRAAPGGYDLICLPLKIQDCEAAPARVFLAPAGTLRRPDG